MKKLLFTGLICSVIITSCQQKPENADATEPTVQATSGSQSDQVKKEASRLRAGGSINDVKYLDGSAEITYVKDYAEYKQLNPQSSLTEQEWSAYWDSGAAVEKAIVEGSVKIMKVLDFVNQVTIHLPYQGKTYSVNVGKAQLEQFLGTSFDKVKADWENAFLNPYVYSDAGREKFFAKFGNIK